MPANNPDQDWERFAQTDPYFAVLTAPDFHGKLSGNARRKFFDSGVEHIDSVLSIIRERLDPDFEPQRALDFGCGVGRLVIPLAAQCDQVTGVDVSPTMLAEARVNCEQAGATNVELVLGDDDISGVRGSFDFVHSYIVLQHIPAERGEKLIKRLVGVLAPAGVAMLHVTYKSGLRSSSSRLFYWARVNVPGAQRLLNLLRGRAVSAPIMQLNEYSITRVLDLLRREGCPEVHVRFSDHGGARGVLLFARKSDLAIFA